MILLISLNPTHILFTSFLCLCISPISSCSLICTLFPPSYFYYTLFFFFLLPAGTLWNLSSYEPLKMVIINHGLQTMTNEVIIPHSGWEHEPNEDSKPRDAEWTTVFKNTSGCLRSFIRPAHVASSDTGFLLEQVRKVSHFWSFAAKWGQPVGGLIRVAVRLDDTFTEVLLDVPAVFRF